MAMTQLETRGLDVCLIDKALTSFGHIENIGQTLVQLRKGRNRRLWAYRVEEFHEAAIDLNWLVDSRYYLSEYLYRDVLTLRENLNQPPPLITQFKDQDPAHLREYLYGTFADIQGFIDSGQWQFPGQVNNPLQLASGLLIEGYGHLVGKFYDRPDLARTTVLAVEEILFNRYPSAYLLEDVLEWMVEERADFPHRMYEYLDTLDQLPRSAMEQLEWSPNEGARGQITAKLYEEMLDYFSHYRIHILNSAYRAKSNGRVREKISNGKKSPFYDFYGLRFALQEVDIGGAVEVVKNRWPTPTALWGGTPSSRRLDMRRRPKRFSHPDYAGVHQNIVFDYEGQKEVAEIQFFTPEQWEKEETTRAYYHQKRAGAK